MNRKELKLSIVTPNLNGGKYIEETIKSIINQNYGSIEYIIIDGGSTDKSHTIIRKYSKYIKYFKIRKDRNMYEAINYGFKLATGDIFTWINSDDYYHKNCLNLILKKIKDNNYNWINCISSSKKKKKITNYPLAFYFPQKYIVEGKCHKSDYGFIPQESVFFTKKLYLKCGEVPARYQLAGDYYFWKKMATHEKMQPINLKCAIFRKRRGQLSGNMLGYYKEIKKKYIYKRNFFRLFLSFVYFIFYGYKS